MSIVNIFFRRKCYCSPPICFGNINRISNFKLLYVLLSKLRSYFGILLFEIKFLNPKIKKSVFLKIYIIHIGKCSTTLYKTKIYHLHFNFSVSSGTALKRSATKP